MYIGYLEDRRSLGYSVIKDSSSDQQLVTVFLIFSKKVLVGVIIILKSKLTNIDQMDQDSHFVLSQPTQVFISRFKPCDSFYDNSRLNKHIKDYIL